MKTEIYLSYLKISTRSFLAAILAGVIEKSNPMTTVIVIVKMIVKKSGKTLNGIVLKELSKKGFKNFFVLYLF